MFNDRFEIQGEIGRGPTGTVFRVREKATGRDAAIKQIQPTPDSDIVFQRFSAEYEKIRSLNHPNIVTVFEHAADEQGPYIVSEFVQGISVHQRIIQSGPISVPEALAIISAVVGALSQAHSLNLLHLNLKPANVLLLGQGPNLQVKVTDFGLWRSGSDPGGLNPQLAFYQAPEQRRNSGINPASDVYALGKLLYVIVSGEMSGRISPESVPANPPLQELIYRCIRTSPEDRFPGMDQTLEAIAAIDAGAASTPAAPAANVPAANAQSSRLPQLVQSAPGAAGGLPTPGQQDMGSTRGEIRARDELDSMLAACARHLQEKRLRTCRNLFDQVQQKAQDYAELGGATWLQENAEGLEAVESQLNQREQELNDLTESARTALEDGQFEDCQLYCTAAQEVCSESVGVDQYLEKAKQMLANITVFWEEAHRALKMGYYEKADIACMKILDLRADHAEALAMRNQIRSMRRRRKMIKLLIVLIILVVVFAIPIGGIAYWRVGISKRIGQFELYVAEERAAAAAEVAETIAKHHLPAREFLDDRRQASDSLDKMEKERDRIDADVAAERSETKVKWNEAEKHREAAEEAFAAGDHKACGISADLAVGACREVRGRLVIINEVFPAMADKDWKRAYDAAVVARDLLPEAKEAEMLITQLKQYLIPELTIRAMVKGQEIRGAYIYVDGTLRDERTPKPIILSTGTRYRVKVALPPRGSRYYVPFETTVLFEQNEAQTLKAELEVVAGPGTEETFMIPEIGIKLKPIPRGTFEMGSKEGEYDEKPAHRVALTSNFWIGVHEVTQGQYQALMKENPSKGPSGPNYPVNSVTWEQAQAFCQRLTALERAAHRVPPEYAYRLPTEAEWEYACRADSLPPEDMDSVAWHAGNAGADANAEVGTKAPNKWDLYDMHGNVAEWCYDWYASTIYQRKAPKDPFGPVRGRLRVVRGGNRVTAMDKCSAWTRFKLDPKATSRHLGFRVVLGKSPRR